MAAEQGLQVDEPGFRRLMGEQRDRAKADARAKRSAHGDTSVYRQLSDTLGRDVEFTGYDQIVTDTRIRGLIRDGVVVDRVGPGDEIEIVLDRTPLYAESGGQQADHGRIRLANGALLEVTDVQRPITGLVVHRATVLEGEAGVGEDAEAEVDVARRRSISRAHTATHMVHQALRDELGDTATQAGSENSPGPPALRLQVAAGRPRRGDGRDRGADQRRAARRPAGDGRHHGHRRREEARRHGALRREVRRARARRLDRRVVARAVRRHAHAPRRPDRRRQAARRELDRLRACGASRRSWAPTRTPTSRARPPSSAS